VNATHVCELGLIIAIRYALSRRQFSEDSKVETLLLDYAGHQRRLIPFIASTYALILYNQDAKMKIVEIMNARQPGIDMRKYHIIAANVKIYGSAHMLDCLQVCREACGGQGYSSYNRIAHMRADHDVDVTVDGDNRILSQQITKSLLDDARKKGVLDDIEQLRQQLKTQSEKIQQSFAQDTNNIPLLQEFFHFRVTFLLLKVGLKLSQKVSEGKSTTEAWNLLGTEIYNVAISYIEKEVFNCFVNVIKTQQAGKIQIKDSTILPLLEKLCILFGLRRIEADFGFFATFCSLSEQHFDAVNDSISALCTELRDHALSLVDAFGIPDHMVVAPIAFDWVKQWSYYGTY